MGIPLPLDALIDLDDKLIATYAEALLERNRNSSGGGRG